MFMKRSVGVGGMVRGDAREKKIVCLPQNGGFTKKSDFQNL